MQNLSMVTNMERKFSVLKNKKKQSLTENTDQNVWMKSMEEVKVQLADTAKLYLHELLSFNCYFTYRKI